MRRQIAARDGQEGRDICGFLCEGYAIEDAREITHLGGWRGYLRR
jgi:allophanate hydrolase